MAEYANPEVLVSTDWVEEQLDDPSVRLIEVDEDTEAYDKGHIWGVGWNWTTDLHSDVGRDYRDQAGFRSCCRPQEAWTRRSCSTAGTTTGSRPTRTGS